MDRTDLAETPLRTPQPEITDAALDGLRRLLSAARGRLHTHGFGDGGLLCEDRFSPAHPVVWRVLPDGRILPDSPYDYRLRAFVPAGLPRSLRAASDGQPVAA